MDEKEFLEVLEAALQGMEGPGVDEIRRRVEAAPKLEALVKKCRHALERIEDEVPMRHMSGATYARMKEAIHECARLPSPAGGAQEER